MPSTQCRSSFTTSFGLTLSCVSTLFHLQIVLEHKVGKASKNSLYVTDLWLLSHPCEPVGWCDFEEDFCSYKYSGWDWERFSLKRSDTYYSPGSDQFYPHFDHTYGVPEGKWHVF